MMMTMMKMRTCVSNEGRERGGKEEGTDRRVRTVSLLLYGLSRKVI